MASFSLSHWLISQDVLHHLQSKLYSPSRTPPTHPEKSHLIKLTHPPQRFNCMDMLPPLGFRRPTHPTLYRFCISSQMACDCYEAHHPTFPLRYQPVCDMLGETDRNDHELQAAHRYCENNCMCYGGPTENWSRWANTPAAVGPRVSTSQLWNGHGTTKH